MRDPRSAQGRELVNIRFQQVEDLSRSARELQIGKVIITNCPPGNAGALPHPCQVRYLDASTGRIFDQFSDLRAAQSLPKPQNESSDPDHKGCPPKRKKVRKVENRS
jgi:hypothetical protein